MEKRVRFGRLPRSFDPHIPHMSALLAAQKNRPPPPPSVDDTKGLPDDVGAMLNDNLGDCTCAAYYHARQVWTVNAQKQIVTEPDRDVEQLYIEACGYNPQAGGEGPGGNEQHVLSYLLKRGAPIGSTGSSRDKILAFVEVDPRNHDDVKTTIDSCGVAYIGFRVPSNVTCENRTWDVDPTATLDGGHAVVLAGYDVSDAIVISWGRRYTMTWAFVDAYVDEAYTIADRAWVEATGKTPGGLSVTRLDALCRPSASS